MLFLPGGASLQFSMVPMNFLASSATADYIDGGSWADEGDQGSEEGRDGERRGQHEGRGLHAHPDAAELKLTPGAAYVHMTSNNTIEGTEYKELPGGRRALLVSDTSSDMFSRPIDVLTPCADLFRRAEEHGTGRRDDRHHSRRPCSIAIGRRASRRCRR